MVAGKIRMMNSWHWYAYQVTVNMMKFICFDDHNLIQPDVRLTSIQLRRIPRCSGLGVSRDMVVSKKWLTCRLRPSEILLVYQVWWNWFWVIGGNQSPHSTRVCILVLEARRWVVMCLLVWYVITGTNHKSPHHQLTLSLSPRHTESRYLDYISVLHFSPRVGMKIIQSGTHWAMSSRWVISVVKRFSGEYLECW